MRRRGSASIAANPVLIGAATTLVVIVAVFLAYNANNGLPFVPSYTLKAQVPSAANLVKGLVSMGNQVGAAKVTGTGAGGDVWILTDAGAEPVLDFTSVGLPSTYHAGAAAVERVFMQLHGHLAAAGVDAIVLEIADGIYQCETAALLRSMRWRRR